MKEKKWDFLLIADYVLLYEKGGFVVRSNKAIGIKNNVIDFIGENSPLLKAKKTYQFKNHLLCPGLINTHTHIPMSLFRGLADNIPLKQWLEEYIFPLENKFVDENFVRVGSLLSAMELIRSGTTTFCDMYFYNQAIAEALDTSGLRGFIGVPLPSVEKEWMNWKDKITQLWQNLSKQFPYPFCFGPSCPLYSLS